MVRWRLESTAECCRGKVNCWTTHDFPLTLQVFLPVLELLSSGHAGKFYTLHNEIPAVCGVFLFEPVQNKLSEMMHIQRKSCRAMMGFAGIAITWPSGHCV